MSLRLVEIAHPQPAGYRKLRFLHGGAEITVRTPPGQPQLDDFQVDDYQVRGRQQRAGDVAWATLDGKDIGSVCLSSSRYDTKFLVRPHGGLGPDTDFLGEAIDLLLDEAKRWQAYDDPGQAATAHYLRETVMRDAQGPGHYARDVGTGRIL